MGGKGSKNKDKLNSKGNKLTSSDYKFLTGQTGLSKADIDRIHNEFLANNPDGRLDKRVILVCFLF
jgi:hypothetical protein